jgi:pimeloyl-ACP methyl ester carboxylesterase
MLERRHDVLAPTLPGHAGGPPLAGEVDVALLADAVESIMDKEEITTAHLVGNSLGGHLALRLAERGRARSVLALAPAGGWAREDRSAGATLAHFTEMREMLRAAAPYADTIVSSDAGRRGATRFTASNWRHIPAELLAHQIRGVAACDGAEAMIESGRCLGWDLDAERITCPVRVVWGTDDRLLPWPAAAARLRAELLPQADWVLLDGVGHCPQLDVPLETAELITGLTRR